MSCIKRGLLPHKLHAVISDKPCAKKEERQKQQVETTYIGGINAYIFSNIGNFSVIHGQLLKKQKCVPGIFMQLLMRTE